MWETAFTGANGGEGEGEGKERKQTEFFEPIII